jgi:hypothetical protein
MAVRRCPKCGLINPETAVACDCGWSFVDKAMGAPRQLGRSEDELRRDRRSRATGQLVGGAVMLLFGSSAGIYRSVSHQLTMSSDDPLAIHAAARQQGQSIAVFVAAIIGIIGMIQIIRGLLNRSS